MAFSFPAGKTLLCLAPRASGPALQGERVPTLRCCANLFNFFGREVYEIRGKGGKLQAHKIDSDVSFLEKIFKVAAIFTLILPLLAFIGAKLYHHLNKVDIVYTHIDWDNAIAKAEQNDCKQLATILDCPAFKTRPAEVLNHLYPFCVKNNKEALETIIYSPAFEKILNNLTFYEFQGSLWNALSLFISKGHLLLLDDILKNSHVQELISDHADALLSPEHFDPKLTLELFTHDFFRNSPKLTIKCLASLYLAMSSPDSGPLARKYQLLFLDERFQSESIRREIAIQEAQQKSLES